MNLGYRSLGFRIDGARWVDTHGDRPMMLVTKVVMINDDPVEMEVPEPIAGVGDDGRYHVGRVVSPRMVARAMMLTEAAEMRRCGVKSMDDREERR